MHLFQLYAGGSTDLGLYLWGNRTLPTVQGLPPPVGGGSPWVVGECVRHCSRSTHHSGAFPRPLSGGWVRPPLQQVHPPLRGFSTAPEWWVDSSLAELLMLTYFLQEIVSMWHSTPLWRNLMSQCLVFILWLSLNLYLTFFPPSGSQLRWNQIEKMRFCLRGSLQLQSNRLWKLDH